MRKLNDPFMEFCKYHLEMRIGLKKYDKRKMKRIRRRSLLYWKKVRKNGENSLILKVGRQHGRMPTRIYNKEGDRND